MHKTGNVVVEGVAIGKIQFLNADYEEQIKRYMTGTEEAVSYTHLTLPTT